jgi:hypothetical protein
MKKVSNKDGTQFCAVEVLDAAAFRFQNNDEWILDMPDDNADIYDATTGDGDSKSTRRSHDEKISPIPGEKDPQQYLKIQRDDMVAFRHINGKEMILNMASGDVQDDGGKNPSRADTFITPQGYDPTNDNIVPPDIDDLNEPHVYFKFMKDSTGILINGDDKVRMGPFWWIRRISGGEIACLEVKIQWANSRQGTIPPILLDTNFGYEIAIGSDLSTPPADNSGNVLNGFAAKLMPKTNKDKPAINLAKDMIWWTGIPNSTVSKDGQFTALIWFNVTKLRPLMPKDSPTIKFRVYMPNTGKSQNQASGIGYYLWIADYHVYGDGRGVPDSKQAGYGPTPGSVWPDPTKDNGLLTGPNNFTPYAMTFNLQDNSYIFSNFNPGFHPTDGPTSNPNGINLGFSTQEGAEAYAAALNQAWQNEYAQAEATVAALHAQGFNIDDTGVYLVYKALTINYADGTNNAQPSTTVTATLADFRGVLSFDYGDDNSPNFDFPKAPKTQTQTVVATSDDGWQYIEFDLDKQGDVAASTQTSPSETPQDDATGGKAGNP